MRWISRRGRCAGIGEIYPVKKIRRDQQTDNGTPDGVFMRQMVFLAKLAVVGQNFIALVLCKWPAIGARCELQQRIQVARLGIQARLFHPPDLGVNAVEVSFRAPARLTGASAGAVLRQASL